MPATSLAYGIALRLLRAGSLESAAQFLVEGVVMGGAAGAAELWWERRTQTPIAHCREMVGEPVRYPLMGFGELRVTQPSVVLEHTAFASLFQAAADVLVRLETSPSNAGSSASLRSAIEALGGFLQLVQLSVPASDRELWAEVSETFATVSRLVNPTTEGAQVELQPPLAKPSARPRILVAEDVPLLQDLMRVQLETLGCYADIAPDGRKALALWEANAYALVLTDLNMPELDGIGLVKAIREREGSGVARSIVLAVTAAAESGEMERCLAAGMDGVLTKPLQIDALSTALQRWLPVAAPSFVADPVPYEHSSATVFNLSILEAQLGVSDPDLNRALVRAFIDSAAAGLSDLAREGYPPPRVVAEMHKLKSSACTIGALHFAGMAIDLEKRTLAGEPWESDHERQRLDHAFYELRRELEHYLASDDTPAVDRLSSIAASALWNTCVVADDDPVIRGQLLALMRSLGGQNIQPAANGEAALARIADFDGKVDLLLCDLQMPVLDGVEVLRRLGEMHFEGAIILLSGAESDVLKTALDLAHLYGLRVLGALPKPTSREALARLLNAAPARRDVAPSGGSTIEITRENLQQAIVRGELTVYLQPQVDSITLQPVGVEALARWMTPDGAFVPPGRFIPFAEEEGLIGQVSERVLELALADTARLHRAGHRLRVSINLSALWIEDLGLPDRIIARVEAAGLKASDVALEITETGLTRDLATALDVLTRLRLRGFGLSLDDFGVGYSSFEQLRRFPFTEIKLDRGFVSNAGRDPASRAIVESMLEIARRLGLPAVAEGVEDEDDLALVRSLGCPKVQGYLFARPMAVDRLLLWLDSQRLA
jgi:EAL domain-containing protein (putative c-di-GMP-specific phosphodiesterase class I)/response regulator of citrate/malate metabolism